MNTTFDILVIVLSVLLAIFLTVSIVAAVLIVRLVQSLRRVVEKGEHVVDSAEAAAEMFKNAAAPLTALRAITSIIETITKHNSTKHNKKGD